MEFQSAVTDAAIAREDRNQARDALLPAVKYDNSGIHTQGNGVGNPIRYIANNAVHEYISQGNVRESFDLAAVAGARRAAALSAVAQAKQEIASRGLVVTVVQGYYGVLATQQKRRGHYHGGRYCSEERNPASGRRRAFPRLRTLPAERNDRGWSPQAASDCDDRAGHYRGNDAARPRGRLRVADATTQGDRRDRGADQFTGLLSGFHPDRPTIFWEAALRLQPRPTAFVYGSDSWKSTVELCEGCTVVSFCHVRGWL